jgi:2-amino-4-hydroxy-6-hydroxymethyldihydropteridine diphosphokinase
MITVFLSLGSNEGDRYYNLDIALDMINEYAGIIQNKSSIYETEPWGIHDQPLFLNMAVSISTTLEASALLETIRYIEKEMGRTKRIKWGQRNIDIDILFYDTIIFQSDELTIPHPMLHERKFVLKPMNEIASGFIHPLSGKTINLMLKECTDILSVKKLQVTLNRLNV